MWSVPVSYTHLDVYKRQQESHPESVPYQNTEQPIDGRYHGVEGGRRITSRQQAGLPLSRQLLCHLPAIQDVYKRQHPSPTHEPSGWCRKLCHSEGFLCCFNDQLKMGVQVDYFTKSAVRKTGLSSCPFAQPHIYLRCHSSSNHKCAAK